MLGPNDSSAFRPLRLPADVVFGFYNPSFSRFGFMLSLSLNTPPQAQLEVPCQLQLVHRSSFSLLRASLLALLDPSGLALLDPSGQLVSFQVPIGLLHVLSVSAPSDPSTLPPWHHLWLPSRPFGILEFRLVRIISFMRIRCLRFVFVFLFNWFLHLLR